MQKPKPIKRYRTTYKLASRIGSDRTVDFIVETIATSNHEAKRLAREQLSAWTTAECIQLKTVEIKED